MLLAGCDGGTDAMRRVFSSGPKGDVRWMADSAMVASKPEVLFRIVDSDSGQVAVPVARLTARGLRELHLTNRGWRAFDVTFMHSTATIIAYRDGHSTTPVEFTRGMWERGTPVDSLAGCPVIVPAARIASSPGLRLATTSKRPPLRNGAQAESNQVQEAMRMASTLVAPTVGISPAELERYTREVHVVPSANASAPSIVMIFNDPVSLADTTSRYGKRARNLVAIIDKGVYGYRPSFVYSTVAVKKDNPRYKWMDYLDVDGDGIPEIFFGVTNAGFETYLIGIRYTVDAWQEFYRSTHARCDL